MSGQNFDPAKLVNDVESLLHDVAKIKAAIFDGGSLNVSDIVYTGEDALTLGGDFLPRLETIENIIAPLIPIIPKITDLFAGDVAGTGATTLNGVVIPSEEIGKYQQPELTPEEVEASKTGVVGIEENSMHSTGNGDNTKPIVTE